MSSLYRELEARLRGGFYSDVLDLAPGYYEQSGTPEEQPLIAIAACKAAGALARWGEAVTWAERGLEVARGIQSEGLLHLLLGTALMYVGDPYKAERSLQKFSTAAESTATLDLYRPDGLFNLALAMRYLKRADQELHCLRRAESAFGAVGRLRQVILCHLEISWTHLLRQEPDPAETQLQIVDRELSEHGDSDLEIFYQICRALLLSQRRQFDDSNRLCETALLVPDLNHAQRADLAWIRGRNALIVGDLTAARYWANEAYSSAVEDWWPLQMEYVEQFQRDVDNTVGR